MHVISGTALPDGHSKPRIKFFSWYTAHGVWVQQTPNLKHCISAISFIVSAIIRISRSGNFIIRASGSDKQMLCVSSGACAALNIAAEKSKQEIGQSHVEIICFCGVVFSQKGELHAALKSFNSFLT